MKDGRSIAFAITIGVLAALMVGCETSDATLRDQGRDEAYIMGFHDGRHSGMREAGNYLEHIVKDTPRFEDDADYRAGWLAGDVEGKRIQEQANAASGTYQAGKIADQAGPHPHDAMKDAMKGVNTDDLKVLEK
jgi:hypothetical protein